MDGTCTRGRAKQGSVTQSPKTGRKLNSYCYVQEGNLERPLYDYCHLKGYCLHDDSQNVLENRTMETEKGLSTGRDCRRGEWVECRALEAVYTFNSTAPVDTRHMLVEIHKTAQAQRYKPIMPGLGNVRWPDSKFTFTLSYKR